jgi:hypothetical protein
LRIIQSFGKLDNSPLFRSTNQRHQIQLATYCQLPASKNAQLILKMQNAMFAETLDNSQYSTRLIPEHRICRSIYYVKINHEAPD